jgi:hypothetical protein
MQSSTANGKSLLLRVALCTESYLFSQERSAMFSHAERVELSSVIAAPHAAGE